jgi:hypothetical protein
MQIAPPAGAAPADIKAVETLPRFATPTTESDAGTFARPSAAISAVTAPERLQALGTRAPTIPGGKPVNGAKLDSRAHHLTAQWRRPSAKSRALVGCDSVPMGRSGPLVSLWPYLQNGRAHGPQRVTRESFGSDRGGRSNMPRSGSNDHGRRAVDHSTGYACSCRTVMYPVECCRSSPSSQRRSSRARQLSAKPRKVPLSTTRSVAELCTLSPQRVTCPGPSGGSQEHQAAAVQVRSHKRDTTRPIK